MFASSPGRWSSWPSFDSAARCASSSTIAVRSSRAGGFTVRRAEQTGSRRLCLRGDDGHLSGEEISLRAGRPQRRAASGATECPASRRSAVAPTDPRSWSCHRAEATTGRGRGRSRAPREATPKGMLSNHPMTDRPSSAPIRAPETASATRHGLRVPCSFRIGERSASRNRVSWDTFGALNHFAGLKAHASPTHAPGRETHRNERQRARSQGAAPLGGTA